MAESSKQAPGQPGEKPHWSSSGAKSGVGKALNAASNVSFTLSHGIINEVYFPREDIVCIDEIGFIVTDGKNFLAEERLNTDHEVKMIEEGIPAYSLCNKCKEEKFVIEKEVITDPLRNTLLQCVTFKPLQESIHQYHLYMFLSPRIKNNGDGNNGWISTYKGVPMIFAERDGITLAAACSIPWKKRSVGFSGVSDGVKELLENKKMVNEYEEAYRGNIMITAEIDLDNTRNSELVIAVGFGYADTEAGNHALASLLDGFETAKDRYINEWYNWQRSLSNLKSSNNAIGKDFRTSATILKVSEAKSFTGGILASLSIPWGEARTEDDLGGYHLVWPRDLVETSWGLLALDAKDDALRIVNYLLSTQEADGSWSQNMWLDGRPYWKGLQMDQVALPLMLINTCSQRGLLHVKKLKRYWEGIRLATEFILKNGPVTEQDRWEMQPGISPFTIATEIAALLSAAEFAEIFDEYEMANYCRQTADFWNENIEAWTYVTDTVLSKEFGVEGYYIRINPSETPINESKDACIDMRRPNSSEQMKFPAAEVISVDALALVRFGLRKPNDPRILNTIKIIDAELKVETPYGPCWHRFTNDTYGEDDEGNPFYDSGKGRAWPLLTGERSHYEVAAGNLKYAKQLLQTMEAFSYHGLFPEQIWDTEDIPEKDLFFGKYTGSAMPLTWAHAEYIKLCNSIGQKRIFDMPEHTYQRYIRNNTKCNFTAWRFVMQTNKISRCKEFLRIEVMASAIVQWSADGWTTKNKTDTIPTGLGVHIADISLKELPGNKIIFTFYWKDSGKWENKDFTVSIVE